MSTPMMICHCSEDSLVFAVLIQCRLRRATSGVSVLSIRWPNPFVVNARNNFPSQDSNVAWHWQVSSLYLPSANVFHRSSPCSLRASVPGSENKHASQRKQRQSVQAAKKQCSDNPSWLAMQVCFEVLAQAFAETLTELGQHYMQFLAHQRGDFM